MKHSSLFNVDAWSAREFKPTPRPQTPIVSLKREEKLGLKPIPFTPVFKLTDSEKARSSPAVRMVVQMVSRISGVPYEEVASPGKKDRVLPRQVATWIARRFTGRSLVAIASEVGGIHHTTVLHALRRIETMIARANLTPPEDTPEGWARALLVQHSRDKFKLKTEYEARKKAREGSRYRMNPEYAARQRAQARIRYLRIKASGMKRTGGRWVKPS